MIPKIGQRYLYKHAYITQAIFEIIEIMDGMPKLLLVQKLSKGWDAYKLNEYSWNESIYAFNSYYTYLEGQDKSI